MELLIESKDQD
ncbi:unnamed protein product, partial [Rotaria sp. Silwood1]